MSEIIKKQVLGRGLAALFEPEMKEEGAFDNFGEFVFLSPKEINLNPYQPRRTFDAKKMQELESSVKEHGVLQPLLVRETKNGYELIAGERRLRIASQLDFQKVPCRVLNIQNKTSLEIALLENIQRADLNCLEEAKGYFRLIEEFSYTQDVLSEKIGKSRSYIANMLRLLSLPEDVKDYLASGELSVGHAKCLVGLKNASDLACSVIKKGLTVRQLEQLIKKTEGDSSGAYKKQMGSYSTEEIRSLETQLEKITGLETRVFWKKDKGELRFFVNKIEEIDTFLLQLTRGKSFS